MTFDDEFNSFSTYNATTHTGTWDTTFGYSGIANRTLPTNGELQIYMDAAYAGTGKTALGVNPFTLENGSLVITATEATQAVSDAISGYQYTSGLITSKDTFSQEYGYFEMRAEMPNEQGAWPAFWLLPADNSWPPEIDIMEGLGDATTAYMTEHSKSTGVHTHDQSVAHLYDTADDYHTYSVLWTADTITWYIDGDVVKTIATPPDMHKPMYILANVAVGGWAGTPADDFNAQMKIDYIRAYSLDQVSATTPTTPVVTTPTTPVVTTPTTPVVTTPTTPVTSSDSSTKTTTDSSTTTTTPVVTGSVWTDTAANNVFTLKTDHDTFTGVGGGTDTVNSGFSWTLAAGIENLVLTGSSALTAAGNDLDNRLTGNAGASTLIGGAGNDTLIAGTGITTMKGGVGNDAYTVSHTGDIIVELAGQGTDSVTSSVSYTLSANVENMSLTGTASLIGTGNDLDNRIIGNAGTSTLIGGAGNDSLIAGTGVTTMKGGVGNDMYTVSHTADVIVENANEGTDSVSSSVTYSLSANIENMSLTGTAAINGTGNALDNRIIGNDGNNSLYGLAGNDYLLGGKGDDKLYGGSGADTFAFRTGDGHDIISDFSISDNDKIDLSAMHAKATAHLSQVGSNVLISFVDGQTITILNESATDKNFLAHIAW